MSIYFIRHGQSEFNALYDPASSDPLIFDAPLSALGHQQAIAASAQVAHLGIKRVIASPLTRAIQTAQHIFKDGPPIEIDPRASEMISNSCDVGRTPAQLAASFPNLSFDHINERWWYQGDQNEHGVAHEPADVFARRVAEFRDWLVSQPTQVIAVVGHGNLFKALSGHMLDNCEIHQFDQAGGQIYSI